ncbi:hypothetical protein ACPOL_2010 [Acidisarcina polymorpha]|uniref:Uncharacterized protein n=1 Tax=Acidisarcina polymorpha TaxID=2211140 RepID=A0A2Z5FY97_9BACT|nr:hypothetical protein ACPOL_2010 [Acidisarcina polymorpha]
MHRCLRRGWQKERPCRDKQGRQSAQKKQKWQRSHATYTNATNRIPLSTSDAA